MGIHGIELADLRLKLAVDARQLGTRVFAALIDLAERAVAALGRVETGPVAVVSRLRGTGRGVSTSALFDALERDHPVTPIAPFENSPLVSGAVWRGDHVLGGHSRSAVARLVWAGGARDLPMHVHDESDRFIVVRRGRGFFHVTDERVERFTGRGVRSIPAREHDVFMFTRGIVHTFSTAGESMELFSCQLPYVPFEQPEQYRLPAVLWTAECHRDDHQPAVACDPAWSVIGRQLAVGIVTERAGVPHGS